VHERGTELEELGFTLVAVGFSPPDALAGLAGHLGWNGPFCSDEERTLYERLGLGRAGVGKLFTSGTRAVYANALKRGAGFERPVEDVRQLGGDALAVNGIARVIFRPSSPDDRPSVDELMGAAQSIV
jgi:hypothetical protein